MDDDKQQHAEPSAANNEFDPADQMTWTAEQREEWNRSGDIPEAPKKPDSAPASAPEKKAKPEAKAESAAEAGTAKESQEQKRGKLSAEERIGQLTARLKEAEAQLAAERERSRAAEPKPPEEAEAKAAEPPKKPTRPKMADFETVGEFEDALAKYEEERDTYFEWLANDKAEQKLREAEQARAAKEANKRFEEIMAEARKRYDDADELIVPTATAIGGDKEVPMAVKIMLNRSDVLPDLLYTLHGELDSFIKLAKEDPAAAIEKIVVTQQLIREQLKKASTKPADDGKETPAQPKPKAPKPPSEVGGRGAAPEDERVEAARANNFTAFEQAEWRRRKQAAR